MRMRLSIAIMLVAVFVGAGCRESVETGKSEKKVVPAPPEDKSAVATVVDGMTGRTAVKQGLKARDKIEQVSAQKNADLKEVYGE
jgi:hypothetical protein